VRAALAQLAGVPSHLALAYDRLAPVDTSGADAGRVGRHGRDAWLRQVESMQQSPDYSVAFDRWSSALEGLTATVCQVRLTSRLLLGHGNPSAAEVGLTVHHTWGTPLLPGSSLKGILAHHLAEKYGPQPPAQGGLLPHPSDPAHPDAERSAFQPSQWMGTRIQHGPGQAIRDLFGAPDADSDDRHPQEGDEDQVGARRGRISFLDGWMVADPSRPSMFKADILNVHQRGYYGQGADGRAAKPWPNDYDPPNPVSFLTVRPGLEFLLAVVAETEQDAAAAQFALEELVEALGETGIGGKTTSGYGRFEISRPIRVLRRLLSSPILDELGGLLARTVFPPGLDEQSSWRDVLGYLREVMAPRFLAESPAVRAQAAAALRGSKVASHRKLGEDARALADLLEGSG
jgi:CRISPR-associated protein Cmr6